MLRAPIRPFQKRRAKIRAASPAPGAPPVLVSAQYDEGVQVRLTFDRAIDIDAFDASKVYVVDGPLTTLSYVGIGSGILFDPQTVQVELESDGAAETPETLLTVYAGNGIKSATGGEMWAGVTNLIVPFP